MNRGFAYSKLNAAVAGAALLAAGACAAACLAASGRARRHAASEAAEIAGLERRCAALGAFDDAHLAATRARMDDFESRIAAGRLLAGELSGLPGSWTVRPSVRAARAGYCLQEVRLRLAAPIMSDWPRIVESVGLVERLPCVNSVGLEMTTSAEKDTRSISLVEITLEAVVPPSTPKP